MKNTVKCDKKKVLVVDDDERVRRAFRMLLRHELPEYTIETATNGAEAIESFESGHHGVLLMDLKMPVMDGLTAFLEIQTQCESKNWEMPSVIFCTGYDPLSTVRDIVADNPAHALLTKPVSNSTLCDMIKSR